MGEYPKKSLRWLIASTAVSLSAVGGAVVAPIANADPADQVQIGPSNPAPPASAPLAGPVPAPDPAALPIAGTADAVPADAAAMPAVDAAPADNGPAVSACATFANAINYAANNYEDFAYKIAGPDDNYNGLGVQDSNVTGRTALREAAGAILDASHTPGLPPDIAASMQSYSLHAGKLIIIMGLHGSGDSLNGTVADMNTDIHATQMACAAAGTHA